MAHHTTVIAIPYPGPMLVLYQNLLVMRLLFSTRCATKQVGRALTHLQRAIVRFHTRRRLVNMAIATHIHLTHGAMITGHCFRLQ